MWTFSALLKSLMDISSSCSALMLLRSRLDRATGRNRKLIMSKAFCCKQLPSKVAPWKIIAANSKHTAVAARPPRAWWQGIVGKKNAKWGQVMLTRCSSGLVNRILREAKKKRQNQFYLDPQHLPSCKRINKIECKTTFSSLCHVCISCISIFSFFFFIIQSIHKSYI